MSVWYCLPSARPADQAEKVLAMWRERGYKLAVFREMDRGHVEADLLVNTLPYCGYAVSQNLLIALVLVEDSACDWLVAGGDDIHPDPDHSPEEIACQCSDWLAYRFGVMQPTGDRWGEEPLHHDPAMRSAYIDRVAGSPWIGREFARRMYGGRGPYWPEYTHMFVDEELRAVALLHGVYWERRELTHFHDHWGRPRSGERFGLADRMPEFLRKANSWEEWERYKALFAERKAAGFPGSEPL